MLLGVAGVLTTAGLALAFNGAPRAAVLGVGAMLLAVLLARRAYVDGKHIVDVSWLPSAPVASSTAARVSGRLGYRGHRASVDLRKIPPPTLYGVHPGPVVVANTEASHPFAEADLSGSALIRSQMFQYWWLRAPSITGDAPQDPECTPRPVSIILINSEADRNHAESLLASIQPLAVDVRLIVDPTSADSDKKPL